MRPDSEDKGEAQSPKRHDHHGRHHGWPPPTRSKAAPPGWNSKTMHHPATRIGEIKHGKT